ncbi:MAG: 2-oxoglutarate dehydrogenase complex dihydrolipoyllysine-residue succinyltransferase [Bacteroidales bacterium]
MAIEVKIPSPGESISEVEIATWFVNSGDFVEKDQEIGEIESEKATLPIIAEESGTVEILKEEGETVAVGTVVCRIDTKGKPSKKTEEDKEKEVKADAGEEEEKASSDSRKEVEVKKDKESEEKTVAADKEKKMLSESDDNSRVKATPLAKKLMEENNLDLDDILQGLKKISTREVNMAMQAGSSQVAPGLKSSKISREEKREKMSNLRKKLSQRLVSVKNETAMLTTFNEADMSRVIELRKKYQDKFVEKHGIKLGFMSFFTKAVTEALKVFPQVNSRMEEDEIVQPEYHDIGIAVQTDKGLMVPVIRNTENLSLADIEIQIMELATKARKNRISIDDMAGGTFTITNGGIFGSMLSTPIINPPQAAILGMHNIIERPVAVNGKVEIRPMMYIALSYDHRIIDGRDSVSFLVKIKELIEKPENLFFGGQNPEKLLLDI